MVVRPGGVFVEGGIHNRDSGAPFDVGGEGGAEFGIGGQIDLVCAIVKEFDPPPSLSLG